MRRMAISTSEQSHLCLVAQGLALGNPEAAEECLLRQFDTMLRQMAFRMRSLIDLDDALQEARVGFLTAIRTYDPSHGVLLSTYAYHCVRNVLARAVRTGRTPIRLPEHIRRSLLLIDRTEQSLLAALGRAPAYEEIAEASGVSVALVQARQAWLGAPISLYKVSSGADGEELLLLDIIPDDRPGPEELALDLRDGVLWIAPALDTLTARDREVILRHFGLPPYSHEQSLLGIARTMGLAQQTVRDAKQRALRALRHAMERDPAAIS